MSNTTANPLFVDSIQVKATAKAGVFITLRTACGSDVFAPLSQVEAQKLTRDLADAVAAHAAHEKRVLN